MYGHSSGDWQLEIENLFIYDIQGNLILEADQSGEILKEYLYLEGNRIAQYGYDDLEMSQGPRPRLAQRGIKPQLQLSVFTNNKPVKKPEIKVATASLVAGMLLQVNPGDIYNEVLYYYINDHLGTPQLMADHEGQVVWRADYDPFGAASVDAGSSTINQHRFPGQYADEETQLHYNYHRYYEPRSGRYITADPIGLIGGINLYGYVGGNPTNAIDPHGEAIVIPLPLAVAFVAVLAYYGMRNAIDHPIVPWPTSISFPKGKVIPFPDAKAKPKEKAYPKDCPKDDNDDCEQLVVEMNLWYDSILARLFALPTYKHDASSDLAIRKEIVAYNESRNAIGTGPCQHVLPRIPKF